MLTFCFSGADGVMTEPELLTAGMVGKQVKLEFSAEWGGLTKTVVFSAGNVTRDAVYTGDTITIPAEVLRQPLKTLYVGVYGVSVDGTLMIPTIRAEGPQIEPGVTPSGDPGTDPDLAIWAQLQALIGKIEDLNTEEKSNLVGALNELAERDVVGATFIPAVSEDGVLSWSNNAGLNNPEPVGIAGPAGADARIIAQSEPPEDTAVLWVDTDDETAGENAFSNPLYGKSISFNGDSICAGSGDTTGGYGKIIAQRNNMTYQNIAVGGATITAELYSTSTGNPYHWISRTVADMDETADYAIVEGGLNDAWKPAPMGAITEGFSDTLDDSTYCGAFESMLKQLITRFPGKKIGYIVTHKSATSMLDFDSRYENNYYTVAIECCRKWGVPYLDLNVLVPPLAHMTALRDAYTVSGDGTHPNIEGYRKFYCDKIEAWLKTL